MLRIATSIEALLAGILGETRSPRRVFPNIDEVPNARTPTLPVSTRPSPVGDAAKPGTDLRHEALVRCIMPHVQVAGLGVIETGSRSEESALAGQKPPRSDSPPPCRPTTGRSTSLAA